MNYSGLVKGMAAGMVVGAAVTMVADPLSERQKHKLAKKAEGVNLYFKYRFEIQQTIYQLTLCRRIRFSADRMKIIKFIYLFYIINYRKNLIIL